MKFKNIIAITLFLFTACFTLFAHAENALWIDVRTVAEYKKDHIKGDIVIPYENIVQEVSKILPDKTTTIRLYCRSGRRAGVALAALKEAGYTVVSNAGGIEDARKERKLVE